MMAQAISMRSAAIATTPRILYGLRQARNITATAQGGQNAGDVHGNETPLWHCVLQERFESGSRRAGTMRKAYNPSGIKTIGSSF